MMISPPILGHVESPAASGRNALHGVVPVVAASSRRDLRALKHGHLARVHLWGAKAAGGELRKEEAASNPNIKIILCGGLARAASMTERQGTPAAYVEELCANFDRVVAQAIAGPGVTYYVEESGAATDAVEDVFGLLRANTANMSRALRIVAAIRDDDMLAAFPGKTPEEIGSCRLFGIITQEVLSVISQNHAWYTPPLDDSKEDPPVEAAAATASTKNASKNAKRRARRKKKTLAEFF